MSTGMTSPSTSNRASQGRVPLGRLRRQRSTAPTRRAEADTVVSLEDAPVGPPNPTDVVSTNEGVADRRWPTGSSISLARSCGRTPTHVFERSSAEARFFLFFVVFVTSFIDFASIDLPTNP